MIVLQIIDKQTKQVGMTMRMPLKLARLQTIENFGYSPNTHELQFSSALSLMESPRSQIDTKQPITVCRIKGLGDIVMMIPTLSSIKQAAPDNKLIVVTSQGGKILLNHLNFIDEIIVTDYRHPAQGLPSAPDIAKGNIVNLINRVDFGDICFRQNRPDNFAKVASKQLGINLSIPQNYIIPDFPIDEKLREGLKRRYGINRNKKNIGCQLKADGKTRIMALNKWIELAEKNKNLTFLFFHDKFIKADGRNIKNLTGKLTIEEFIHFISICDIFICTDTSGMHLAPMVNTSVILLAGSTKIEYHTKYNKSWLVYPIYAEPKLKCSPCFDWQVRNDCYNRKDFPWCLNRIKTEQITSKIKEILDG